MTAERCGTTPVVVRLALLADQHVRWRRGERVAVEAYLEHCPALRYEPGVVLDLLYHEIVLREERGDALSLEEYGRRFPVYKARLRDQIRIHRLFQGLLSR
jgi:hypothetical protein